MQFKVSANFDELKKHIKAKHEGVQTEVRKELVRTSKDVRTTLYGRTPVAPTFSAIAVKGGRRVAPYTHMGGRARAAFTQSPKEAGDAIFKIELEKYRAEIGSNVFYMKFLEYGTRAHGPKTAQFLRFGLPEAGVIFTKWVKGIKPMKIFLRTNEQYKVIFPQRIEEATRRGLNKQ